MQMHDLDYHYRVHKFYYDTSKFEKDKELPKYNDICENIIMAYRSTDKKPIFEDNGEDK